MYGEQNVLSQTLIILLSFANLAISRDLLISTRDLLDLYPNHLVFGRIALNFFESLKSTKLNSKPDERFLTSSNNR